ncbi:MAG: DUF4430 domain-containing protein [Clostridia bacterium]|nr:DUF4430 domain-containing protein [Clostridia bacterium]
MKKYRVGLFVMIAAALLLAGCRTQAAQPASSAISAVSSSSAAAVSSSAAAVSSNVSSSAAVSSKTASSHAASAPSSAAQSSSVSEKTVTVLINASREKGYGVMLPAAKVAFQSGDTAYSVLIRACKQHKIAVDASDFGAVYVRGINGLEAIDICGWIYRVNGVMPGVACNKFTLKPGDLVEWIYTLDNGKTEGAKQ